jgi:hypothetical protein
MAVMAMLIMMLLLTMTKTDMTMAAYWGDQRAKKGPGYAASLGSEMALCWSL